jgi:hypothetical protein
MANDRPGANDRARAGDRARASGRASAATGNGLKLVLAWGFVGIPLAWGVIQTLVNAIKAFH